MAIWQGSSLRKPTGARSRRNRNKRNAEFGRVAAETRIGDEVKKEIVVRGNGKKIRATVANKINVIDPKDNSSKSVEIKTVLDNSANSHFIRRNIVTKGAIVETELGQVRITSRPGQNGIVNGVLIE
ncbi:MAG: 30S ribosomal protein S8e [Methanosphaera sp.]|uniref:30S ribosomal protein S8e n=1 Tax=Methanosphaera sp. BMS TaxID=1789762 RepID=UPI000DC1BEE4|nr:30S ribosomal protein S8e [Methanosphaera sp. BMS]AWX33260.1 30S ribosomal protein S8e [Methanosphaera sp. BMS]MBO7719428.1 30S ribosomal protein S8e [Methanosphaera sp.]MBQ6444478.1 30S ribosomal protein S8e [Methanosphaera sp.]